MTRRPRLAGVWAASAWMVASCQRVDFDPPSEPASTSITTAEPEDETGYEPPAPPPDPWPGEDALADCEGLDLREYTYTVAGIHAFSGGLQILESTQSEVSCEDRHPSLWGSWVDVRIWPAALVVGQPIPFAPTDPPVARLECGVGGKDFGESAGIWDAYLVLEEVSEERVRGCLRFKDRSFVCPGDHRFDIPMCPDG